MILGMGNRYSLSIFNEDVYGGRVVIAWGYKWTTCCWYIKRGEGHPGL